MYSTNHWGGSLDISNGGEEDDENKRLKMHEFDRASLQQMQATQQSWLLYPQETKRKKKYIDLGCVVISAKAFKYGVYAFLIAFLVIALPIIIVKTLPHRPSRPPPPDNYTLALHKALLFFNAQKSGKLPKNNGIPWRGDSGLSDGNDTDFKTGLVGGYYDAGDNIKFHFPMAFSMSMLSWSLIEYRHKYETIGEYKHMRELIKWGADYLLLTFNSSASKIDRIYSQVGSPGLNGSTTPNDHYCWQRPEDMDYSRPSQFITSGPDLAGEMAAALASASIVFRDDEMYSQKLVKGAKTVFAFARDGGRRRAYSRGNPYVEPFYNSTGYYDEYMWGAAWMYYATGNISYLSLATNPGLLKNAKGSNLIPNLNVLSWDNKLPAAMLLLTRYRLFINPGYPYEDMLRMYHNLTELTMCSYLHQFNVYNWTKGGMIQLSKGRPQPLQYVANAAFLTSLFADYLNATDIPGIYCGPTFIRLDALKNFATSQIDYILGKNPKKMSYVVGFGSKFPRHVYHRGASIQHNGRHYSCTGGWSWRDSSRPNPNNVTGAMVGGPDRFDNFRDLRSSYNHTEPTLAGNAGLVAALASLTASGGSGSLDKNSIFSAVPPLYPPSPPPPKPWKP